MTETWQTVKSDGGVKMWHREWLVALARTVDSQFYIPTIVNIGVYYGASMHCFRAGAPLARLWGVDIKDWKVEKVKWLYANYIWDDSTKCHQDFNELIHLLFISGVQVYEEVKKDIAGWAPKVEVNGVIAFCCYHLPSPRWGTKQAWIEWELGAESRWNRVDTPHPMQAFRRIE